VLIGITNQYNSHIITYNIIDESECNTSRSTSVVDNKLESKRKRPRWRGAIIDLSENVSRFSNLQRCNLSHFHPLPYIIMMCI